MSLAKKVKTIYENEGISSLIFKSSRYCYNNIVRDKLPKTDKYVVKNGVKVDEMRIFDDIVPFKSYSYTDNQNHESTYVEMIRKHIKSGQKIIVVGGGWGVSTVVAAKCVGNNGNVICYEGSNEMYYRTNKTVELNNVDGYTDVKHAIVSDDVRLGGDRKDGGTSVISLDEVPEFDVLLVDCDGCEISLLSEMNGDAELVILEHHAVYDGKEQIEYQPKYIKQRLESLGYEIIDTNTAPTDSSDPQFGEKETVFVASK